MLNRLAACFVTVSSIFLADAASAERVLGAPSPAMLDVPAGDFVMGRPEGQKGESDELPRRTITLPAYRIGMYELTNAQCAAILNWAHDNGRLEDPRSDSFSGRFEGVYRNGRFLKSINEGRIAFSAGRFYVLMQDGLFMEDHPVMQVSWFGAVALCNWLSEMHGLEPAYDLRTWQRIVPETNGYRLPTEAEWERAAAWNAETQSPQSVELTAENANFAFSNPLEILGMKNYPYTTPVGYFDGDSPNAEYTLSPVGCFDMAGNVYEWCEDWFAPYSAESQADPRGPDEGDFKVVRGGGWSSIESACRPYNRGWSDPGMSFRTFGFRLAQSIP